VAAEAGTPLPAPSVLAQVGEAGTTSSFTLSSFFSSTLQPASDAAGVAKSCSRIPGTTPVDRELYSMGAGPSTRTRSWDKRCGVMYVSPVLLRARFAIATGDGTCDLPRGCAATDVAAWGALMAGTERSLAMVVATSRQAQKSIRLATGSAAQPSAILGANNPCSACARKYSSKRVTLGAGCDTWCGVGARWFAVSVWCLVHWLRHERQNNGSGVTGQPQVAHNFHDCSGMSSFHLIITYESAFFPCS